MYIMCIILSIKLIYVYSNIHNNNIAKFQYTSLTSLVISVNIKKIY